MIVHLIFVSKEVSFRLDFFLIALEIAIPLNLADLIRSVRYEWMTFQIMFGSGNSFRSIGSFIILILNFLTMFHYAISEKWNDLFRFRLLISNHLFLPFL